MIFEGGKWTITGTWGWDLNNYMIFEVGNEQLQEPWGGTRAITWSLGVGPEQLQEPWGGTWAITWTLRMGAEVLHHVGIDDKVTSQYRLLLKSIIYCMHASHVRVHLQLFILFLLLCICVGFYRITWLYVLDLVVGEKNLKNVTYSFYSQLTWFFFIVRFT